MSFGTDIAAEVSAALAEASIATGDGELIGQVLTPGQTTGDPWAPNDQVDPSSRDARMVISQFNVLEIDGSLIQATDRKIMVERMDPPPTTSDQISLAGKIYDIQSVDTLEPGGVAIYHKVQARMIGYAPVIVDNYDQTESAPVNG